MTMTMTIQMASRLLPIAPLHIDTNLINARQKLVAVNQLEKWRDDGVILIVMSSTAYVEAKGGNNKVRTRKANQHIFTDTSPAGPDDEIYRRVAAAIFPGGVQSDSDGNDVEIVAEAAKYNGILVTGDGASVRQPGGILGNREKLKDLVTILSPDEAVILVRQRIRERDEFNVRVASELCIGLPPWTGSD